MSQSAARVPTAHASRYLQQLSKHWAHKLEVTFDATRSDINFGDVTCVLTADDAALDILIVGPEDQMERYEGVIQRHLERFAFREGELVFDWTRQA
jgi:hypothetical protein